MRKIRLVACAVALTVGGLTPLGLSPAAADPASAAVASGYGARAAVAGTAVVDRAGLATATLPPGQDAGPTALIPITVTAPLVVSGTAIGEANAHANSDLPSKIVDPNERQGATGPYNARGVGLVQNLGVLTGLPGALTTPVVTADAVRAEAVGVCRGGRPVYSASSEVVNLQIGGTTLPLNGVLTGLIGTLNTTLTTLMLDQVVSIKQDEISTLPGGGVAINALHVTVLSLTGTPVLDLIVGQAQVDGLQCARVPQCSDTQDNDGDGVVDAQDPGCITNGVYDPNDDDERNECIDGIDNADPEDSLVDFGSDPGCTDPQDDNETDDRPDGGGGGGQILARTGGNDSSSLPLAAGFGVLAFGAMVLRRRSQASR